MQHNHVLKKMNFDPQGRREVVNLICNMTMFCKVEFNLTILRIVAGGGGSVILFNLICNMTMF